MGFQERLKELEELYGAEIITPQALEKIRTDCHHKVVCAIGVRGAYHLWEDGFSRGGASREDIFEDAKRMSSYFAAVDDVQFDVVHEDFEDVLSDVLVGLDRLYLEIYMKSLLAIDEERHRGKSGLGASQAP